MDACLLCLELNKDLLDFIEANSTRWQELNITKVLEKHFWPLNTIHPNSWMCKSCWQEVDDFHKFYLRIEEAHVNFGKIKTEEISGQENENFSCYLEPEILIDQNTLSVSVPNSKEFCTKHDKNNMDENIVLNKDPLLKTKITRPRKAKKTSTESILSKVEQNVNSPEIKSEPKDSSDNDNSDSITDEEDDEDEPDQISTKSVKNKNGTKKTHKENDKFIEENFKQMSCDLCDIPFKSFPAMQKHFSTVHNQKGYLICCSRKFYQRYRLVDHLLLHLNPDHYKCTQCDRVMSNRDNFKNHMLRSHRPNDVTLTHFCNICDKSFIKPCLLRRHQLKHLPEEEKKFNCTQCGKFYASSEILNHHIQAVHLKKFGKICYICGKSINNSAEYKLHMDKHEGIPRQMIDCDICGLRLTSERGLKRHKETQHPVGGKKEHPCPICPKISPTLVALRKHINTMHKKGYDHKCAICEKAFKRAETLREHMASHTGTALYTCPWCPQTFNSNGNMHAHRKKVHPKEWEETKLQKYSENLPSELKATILNNSMHMGE